MTSGFVGWGALPEDVERYQLPPDFTKATDSRRAAFVERFGDVAVELWTPCPCAC